MEKTTTCKSQTGDSKVTLPSWVKGIKSETLFVILFYARDLLLDEIENVTTLV